MSEEKSRLRNVSNYILPTSANLLGICFLIFSLVHERGNQDSTYLDECSASAVVIFLLASIFSYVSIRAEGKARLERWADWLFMAGLCLLAASSLLMTFSLMH